MMLSRGYDAKDLNGVKSRPTHHAAFLHDHSAVWGGLHLGAKHYGLLVLRQQTCWKQDELR